MPIRVSDLKEATKPLKDRIFDWLARRPGEAFRLEEIIAGMTGADHNAIALIIALGSIKPPNEATKKIEAGYKEYEHALQELKSEGRVDTGEVRGATYYYAAEKKP
jgi:hypothetical protein